ncbi:MAG: hypothetical protein HY401_04400 [Elusimicrobia bacterium]|nr:hypothetical protein [Elusimicrobiota bacterium]
MTKPRKRALTIGTFDGLHLGHRKALEGLLRVARQKNLEPMVAIFPYSPRVFLYGNTRIVRLLTTVEERIRILREEFGIRKVAVLGIKRSLLNLSAGEFLKRYACGLWRADTLVFGENFALGKDRLCDSTSFQRFLRPLGLRWRMVRLKTGRGLAVSSTRIRGLLAEGDVSRANRLLGRPYRIGGRVVRGEGIGRRLLGIATANLSIDPAKILPLGVFRARAPELDRLAVVNIGFRPTVRGQGSGVRGQKENRFFTSPLTPHPSPLLPVVEAHVLDFKGNLYGRTLTLELLSRIRGEKKFGSLEDLRAQIMKDVKIARGG